LLPQTQRRYLGVLSRNAKDDHNWTNDSLREYQKLKGLAATEPAEFIDHNVIETDLPNSAKRELINLQGRLQKQAEGDPRVARALAILAPDLNSAGIDKKNKEEYNLFAGAISDQLQDFATENKRPPKLDEIKLMGSRLLQAQSYPGRFWGTNEATTFHVPVPSEEQEKIQADPAWAKLGIKPTEQQVQRIYTRKLYQDLYGGVPKTAANAPTAPVSR
jgi:hypothetical protein